MSTTVFLSSMSPSTIHWTWAWSWGPLHSKLFWQVYMNGKCKIVINNFSVEYRCEHCITFVDMCVKVPEPMCETGESLSQALHYDRKKYRCYHWLTQFLQDMDLSFTSHTEDLSFGFLKIQDSQFQLNHLLAMRPWANSLNLKLFKR